MWETKRKSNQKKKFTAAEKSSRRQNAGLLPAMTFSTQSRYWLGETAETEFIQWRDKMETSWQYTKFIHSTFFSNLNKIQQDLTKSRLSQKPPLSTVEKSVYRNITDFKKYLHSQKRPTEPHSKHPRLVSKAAYKLVHISMFLFCFAHKHSETAQEEKRGGGREMPGHLTTPTQANAFIVA